MTETNKKFLTPSLRVSQIFDFLDSESRSSANFWSCANHNPLSIIIIRSRSLKLFDLSEFEADSKNWLEILQKCRKLIFWFIFYRNQRWIYRFDGPGLARIGRGWKAKIFCCHHSMCRRRFKFTNFDETKSNRWMFQSFAEFSLPPILLRFCSSNRNQIFIHF